MKVKKTAAITLGTFMVLSNGTPVFAQNNTSSVLAADIYSDMVGDTIENVSNLIQDNIDAIEIEVPEPVQEVSYTYVQETPVYTYTVQETANEPVTMSIEEFLAMYGQEESTEVVPADTSEQQAAYEEALANYNAALAEYEAASQIVETTKEVEVEVVEESVDEEGNIVETTHTETQTVTETSTSGDVDAAMANVEAAKAALDVAESELKSAQNTIEESVSPAETPENAVIEVEESVTEDAVNSTIVNSGKCGDNLTWTLDDEGLLTISGFGNMYNYQYYNGDYSPWNEKTDIKNVVIEHDVTSIGDYAFSFCTSLAAITIPDSVTTIGSSAFLNCSSLTAITIPDSVTSIGNYVFYNCRSLAEITIPDSVTSIGRSVFSDCTSLTEITIPDSVTTIGDYAFLGCTSLAAITIPDSVTTIGSSAFLNCSSLTAITIPDSVTTIGDYAFLGCTSLTEITIPDSVTSFGDYTFYNCSSLTAITIPDSVTSFGDYTFYNCLSLTAITIPDSVTSIGSGAFNGCTSLTEITIPDSVTSIGSAAFNGCTSLTEITIPDSVTTIGNGAFNGCTSLTEITIPDSVTSIGSGLFENCTSLTEITIPDSVTSIGSEAFRNCTSLTEITIPDSVTSIGDHAFYDCRKLTEITIGDSVTSIGDYAFYDCYSIAEITIPDSVTSIGESAFSGCTSLTEIIIPDSVTSIQNNVFSRCTSLTLYVYPDSTALDYAVSNKFPYVIYYPVESLVIEDMKIPVGTSEAIVYTIDPDNCSDPTVIWTSSDDEIASIDENGIITAKQVGTVTITGSTNHRPLSAACTVQIVANSVVDSGTCGDNLTWTLDDEGLLTISGYGDMYNYQYYNGDYSPWHGKTDIKNVVIEDDVTSIGNCAFYGSTSLTEITIPSSVASIGWAAFYNCTSLTEITIPDSVTSIAFEIFYGCTSLTEITIPDSVTSIGDYAFWGCTGLSEITIPSSVFSIEDYAFEGCTSLIEISIPSSVTYIGGSAFSGCTSLTEITIPDSITSIEDYAFTSCTSLTEITIPDSVTSVGRYAFSGCTNLTELAFGDSVANIGSSAFLDCTSLTKIVIPDGVTFIDSDVFSNCTSLTEITIPDSVTLIDSGAFWSCTSLTEITIPDSVSIIGTGAFYDCTSLTGITIPNNVTSILSNAFANCSSLETLLITDNVTSIGNDAFNGCTSLTLYVYPNSTALDYAVNNEIPYEIYYPVESLVIKDMKIPVGASVATIYKLSPDNCSDPTVTWTSSDDEIASIDENGIITAKKIGTVTITGSTNHSPLSVACTVQIVSSSLIVDSGTCGDNLRWTLDNEGLLTIYGYGDMYDYPYCDSDSPWYGKTNIKNVVIEHDATSIGDDAFRNCTSLTEITIPDSVTSIGIDAFSYCTSLTEITIPSSVTSIGASAFTSCTRLTEITIPNSVTSIGDNTFFGCDSLTDITIPDSVTSIGNYAFYNCSSLTEITIPDSVTSIGASAFSGCTRLTEITIPDSVTSIGNSIFRDCDTLKYLFLGSNVTNIGNDAFLLCRSLTEITIPDSVISIGDSAFSQCSSLTEITIPSSVTSIGAYAFSHCYSLAEITIPDSVTSIGAYAFYNCNKLTKIIIPSAVTSIGDNTFFGCDSLTEVTIPDSVTTIGYEAFSGCRSLTEITIPDSVISIGGRAFYYCSSLQNAVISSKVTSLAAELFSGCTKLESVIIPEGVKKIGNDVFNGCNSLTDISLPNSLTSIGRNTFTDCRSLETLLITDNVTSIGTDTFNGCTSLTLYVYPDSTALDYAVNNEIPYVIYYPVESLVIEDMKIPVGTSEAIVYTIDPVNCSDPTVIWTSSDDEIASIDENGIITAKQKGFVTITGSTYRRPFDITCTVEVVVPAESISLDMDHAFVQVGNTVSLSETILPENASDKTVIWTSSDDNVAIVSEGVITGISDGRVTITAITNDGGYSASCEIYVYTEFVPVEEIILDKTELDIFIGSSDSLSVSFNPEHPTNEYYVWVSDDPAIASVQDGVVTAVNLGTTIIKAISEDGSHVAECIVNVFGTLVDGVSLDAESLNIEKGKTGQLVATVSPDDATIKNVTWSSSDESVATVDENGFITALDTGTATITVTTEDGGFTAACEVTVFVIPVESVELDKEAVELIVGESDTLIATINPENPTDDQISWISSDPSVVSVDNGVITALKEGTSTISVITNDGGHTADCVVTVKRIPVRNISFEQSEIEIVVGETDTLSVIIEPSNATYQDVSWMSDDPGTVTVDESGMVTAVKLGSANIFAISEDGGFSAQCHVTVISPIDSIDLDKSVALMAINDSITLTAITSPHYTGSIQWTSSDANIASVANGVVTGLSAGTVTIQATNSYGKSAQCQIRVYAVGVTGIELSAEDLIINVNETAEITATVLPVNATNKNVVWTSSDESIATVTDGLVTGISRGKAVITAVTADGGYSAECLITVNEDAVLRTEHTLSLEGNIAVNFYFSLADYVKNDSGTKVEFTIDGNTVSQSIGESTEYLEFNRFSVDVSYKQMTTDIHADVILSTGEVVYSEEYRAKDYCDEKLANSTITDKFRNLLETLLNYGGYAQLQFGYKTDDLANADLQDTDVSDVTIEQLAPYKAVTAGSEEGITLAGSTLTLNSLTSIKHYFTIAEGHSISEYTFKLNDEELTPVKSGQMYYVEIPNIASKELDAMYTVTVGDYSITYAALSYAYDHVNRPNESETLKDVCRALYKYNQAADAYFGG